MKPIFALAYMKGVQDMKTLDNNGATMEILFIFKLTVHLVINHSMVLFIPDLERRNVVINLPLSWRTALMYFYVTKFKEDVSVLCTE